MLLDVLFPALSLAGAVALLLWGSHMVQTGVQRAFGPRLRLFLGRTLRNRLVAFGAGIGVTLLLQSSTATGLMATSLTAGAVVDLVPALAVMLGANVGTAAIVQVLAFDVVAFSPVLILTGVILFRRVADAMLHDLGRVLIGLGLMLLALHQMLAVIAPLEESPQMQTILHILGGFPILALALAALGAWAVHSSVAIVLLIVSLAAHGIVPLDAALMMVLGANLGTALNPLLEAASAADPASRRLPLGNLLNRAIGVLVAGAMVGPLAALFAEGGLLAGHSVALFHLAFNVVTAVLALPLLEPLATLLRRMLPDRIDPADPRNPLYLDAAARETPVVALGSAAREALRLADALEQMLEGARSALLTGDRRLIASVRDRDDVLDSLNRAINGYLTAFDPEALSEDDRRRMNQVLSFTMNMEQAGDVVDRTLLPHLLKRIRRGVAIPPEGQAELNERMERLIANLRTAASLLMTDDPRAARLLAHEKLAFRRAEREATSRHLQNLRGAPATAEGSACVLDLLRDMKLINSFIVAAAAYPVLDRTGELLPSRIASGS